jgi:averantin hydroxylase
MDNVLLRTDFEKGTGMTKEEMVNNASILVLGGSETTATLLSGTVYLLLKHPAELKKLNEEVRRSFQDESEIDLVSIGRLSYLGAVLDEAMRVYPPAPNMGNRLVPMPGVEICGEWVPGGVSTHLLSHILSQSLRNIVP